PTQALGRESGDGYSRIRGGGERPSPRRHLRGHGERGDHSGECVGTIKETCRDQCRGRRVGGSVRCLSCPKSRLCVAPSRARSSPRRSNSFTSPTVAPCAVIRPPRTSATS